MDEQTEDTPSEGSAAVERLLDYWKLSPEERAILDSKAKGRPVESFLRSVVLTNIGTKKAKTDGSETRKSATLPEDMPVVVIGPFSPPRRTTIGELHAETEAANLRAGILHELLSGTDRATGIVGGAFVEDGVEKLIRACWRSEEKSVGEAYKLFRPGGPLSSFATKNSLAFLSRLVGERTFRDLNAIKEIRNKFAHWLTMDENRQRLEVVEFDSPLIADHCNSLQYAAKMEMEFADKTYLRPDTPRSRFVLTVIQLGQQIHGCAQLVSKGMNTDQLQHYLL